MNQNDILDEVGTTIKENDIERVLKWRGEGYCLAIGGYDEGVSCKSVADFWIVDAYEDAVIEMIEHVLGTISPFKNYKGYSYDDSHINEEYAFMYTEKIWQAILNRIRRDIGIKRDNIKRVLNFKEIRSVIESVLEKDYDEVDI